MDNRNNGFRPSRRQVTAGLGALAGAGAASLLPSAARAEQFPARTITIIAPAAAGGPTDTVSRAAALHLQRRYGQSVIVENRGGAAGNLGAQVAARATPDGYTLVTLLAPLAQNVAIYKAPGFSLEKDFRPLAHMASTDLLIIAHPSLPANDLDTFLAYTKANPDKVSCGSQSPPQMAYLKRTTGAQFTVIPYKGSALITNDVIGGQISIGLVPYSDAAQHINADTVKPLFTNGPRRVAKLPNVPAVNERFPGFSFWSWYGVAAPAATPDSVCALLSKDLCEIARSSEFQTFLGDLGLAPVNEPEKFGEVISAEVALWRKLADELSLPKI